MPHIVVDDEQARIISEATGSIEVRDRSGKHLGYVARDFTDEEIALAKARAASSSPRLTTDEVLEHLRSLEQ